MMPIEASFSWRLLFRIFQDNNGPDSFDEWFRLRLPVNGHQLTLRRAFEVIVLKLRRTAGHATPFYLFLGIDDFQVINRIHAQRVHAETSVLRELVDTITGFACFQTHLSGLVVLPMLGGKDWDAIQSDASSSFRVKRLSMTFLRLDQMYKLVRPGTDDEGLLEHSQVCRDLFALGGIPRWIVEYLKLVKKAQQEKEVQAANQTAYSLSSRIYRWTTKFPSDTLDGNVNWSTLQDLCLITPLYGVCSVQVSYALLRSVGMLKDAFANSAEKAFALSLSDLKTHVDDTMLILKAWQSKAMFGAYFYAVRINALLVPGHSTVTLGKLLSGALMDSSTRDISRQRSTSKDQPCDAGSFVTEISTPTFLAMEDARLVRGVIDIGPKANISTCDVPINCYVMSRGKTEEFHGTLASHPACSPVILIHFAPRAAIKSILEEVQEDSKELLDEMEAENLRRLKRRRN
ncbi:hypothetical protein GN958_ATG16961 [Phytophthora infestans]|uniref:Crinkler (CRN) family protein n=1 Tax=Phytophthora infestans TaxID=4787 RepID=A0A8S9U422_PHYIN|nr:hypothetical protein GN958_ATG16961 [Phytophthora infestans]